MARFRFRGEVQGDGGPTSRQGTQQLWTRAKSDAGDIYVEMHADGDEDWVRILTIPHSSGQAHLLYNGLVATLIEKGLHGLMADYAQRALATTKEDEHHG